MSGKRSVSKLAESPLIPGEVRSDHVGSTIDRSMKRSKPAARPERVVGVTAVDSGQNALGYDPELADQLAFEYLAVTEEGQLLQVGLAI